MIEGIDYFVRYVRFPNRANDGCTIVNDDGTFDIYLNTRYTQEHLMQKLAHELRHLENEHFYRHDMSIADMERQANGIKVEAFEVEPKKYIRSFSSMDAFTPVVSQPLPRKRLETVLI